MYKRQVQDRFEHQNVSGIRAEELSGEIFNSVLVRMNKVFAYVDAHIAEECEDNLLFMNMYKYGYTITLKLKGIVVNEVLAAGFSQMVAKSVDAAVKHIESQCPLTWENF